MLEHYSADLHAILECVMALQETKARETTYDISKTEYASFFIEDVQSRIVGGVAFSVDPSC